MSAAAKPRRRWLTPVAWSFPLWLAGAMLYSWGEPHVGCASDVVKSTLASTVRGRITQVVADGLPDSLPEARRAKLAKATWIAVRDPHVLEWEQGVGRLHCVAAIVVDAKIDDRGAHFSATSELRYRVARSDADTVLVEVNYADLMNLFAMPAAPVPPALRTTLQSHPS
jgi:hypothetical protein